MGHLLKHLYPLQNKHFNTHISCRLNFFNIFKKALANSYNMSYFI